MYYTQTYTLEEKDYVAVYDKKMLWRANLYIDETDVAKNIVDWNDAHPWNAPAEPAAGPDWWDKGDFASSSVRWGYNEWNRVYNNSYTANLGIYQKFEDLPAGKGRQVVEIPNTTWYYGMSHSVSETSFVRGYDKAYQKSVENRVAYDYWGWDSPFSFRKKIQEQLKISGLDEIPDYNEMTFPLRYGFLMADGKPTVVYSKRDEEGNITFYPKFFDTYTTVDEANNPQPPEGSGVKRSALVTKDGITLHPYIPGMSDQLSYKVDGKEKHSELAHRLNRYDCRY